MNRWIAAYAAAIIGQRRAGVREIPPPFSVLGALRHTSHHRHLPENNRRSCRNRHKAPSGSRAYRARRASPAPRARGSVDVGPVFEPQIEQPQRKADDLQDEFEFHRLKPHRYVGQHVEHRLGKIEGRIFAHTSDNRRITVAVVTILRIEKIVDLHAETHASDLRGSQFIPQVQVGDTVVVERQRIVAAVGKVLFADILRMQQGAEPFDMEIQ